MLRLAVKKTGVNTMIGPGAVMEGRFSFAGFTRIDGHISGDVDAQGEVVVGESARLLSNMTAESVTVGGVVRGDVLASENIVVLSTGIILGDLVTGQIKADDGCIIHGHITICRDKGQFDAVVGERRDRKAVSGA
jgi:cytoskeletal protein CcmA (bactofilin family)